MALDLSVVITTYNSSRTIRAALGSLAALEGEEAPAEIIVVDNASTDGSAGLAAAFDGVRVIRSTSNMGLARANNAGAAAAGCSSLFFMNPDVEVLPGCFRKLGDFAASSPGACLLGPLTLGADGEPVSSARTFPSMLDVLLRRSPLGRLATMRDRLDRHLYPAGLDAPSQVDWLCGAALWLTASGRDRVGLMSESYFLYFEDVEWAWRAHTRGMEVWLVPEARVRHAGARESARSMLIFYSTHPSAILGSSTRR